MSQTLPLIEEGRTILDPSAPGESSSGHGIPPGSGLPSTHLLGSSAWMQAGAIQRPPMVEVAIPVYNEERSLEASVRRLRSYLNDSFPFDATVRIVDNASTDNTWAVATRLAAEIPGVSALHLDRKGRGFALRSAWSSSTAEIVAYMDVDLSTDLGGFLPLIAPLLSGYSDVAIGSRLAPGARVVRGPKRELISRTYNFILKMSLPGHFSDAQCGFKALRRVSAERILPLVQDQEWFFDTELLVVAERLGLRVSEVAVDWVDDPDSRVQVLPTAIKDLRGVWRLSHGQSSRQIVAQSQPIDPVLDGVVAAPLIRFAGIGAISTLSYLILFVACRQFMGTYAANALALAVCAIFNLVLHKQLAHRGVGSARRRLAGAAFSLYTISLTLTTLALLAAHALAPSSLSFAVLVVTGANAVAAALRFAVLRAWIFRSKGAS
jgi:putative flippase GtrA